MIFTVCFVLAGYTYKRVCYFTNWSQYRPGNAKFQVANIDSKLCSHIIYAFATMEGHKLKQYEWNDDGATGQWVVYVEYSSNEYVYFRKYS